MAGEIKLTISGSVSKGGYKETIPSETFSIDQAAIGSQAGVVTVGTSEEDLAVGDVGTLGWLYLKNLDGTNYVTYGAKDTVMKALGRLKPSEFALLRLEPGVTLRWKADTAPVKVRVILLEN